jgi:hypothetical protein
MLEGSCFYRNAEYFQITLGNKAYNCICRIVGRKGAYGCPGPREFLFASIASAAESFQSRCGSVRRPPECSKQGSPGNTARRTGHREAFFCCQVALLHFDTVRQNQPQNCSILNGMRTVGTWRACQTTVDNGRVAALDPPRHLRAAHRFYGFGRKFELSTVNSLPSIPAIMWDSHSWLSSPLVARQFLCCSDGHIAILLF